METIKYVNENFIEHPEVSALNIYKHLCSLVNCDHVNIQLIDYNGISHFFMRIASCLKEHIAENPKFKNSTVYIQPGTHLKPINIKTLIFD